MTCDPTEPFWVATKTFAVIGIMASLASILLVFVYLLNRLTQK